MDKISSANPNVHFASVAPKDGEEVEGILWEVDEPFMAVLDFHEGVKTGQYTRMLSDVFAKTGYVYKAYIYIGHPNACIKTGEVGKTSREYLNKILVGAKEFGLSGATISKLESWPTID